MSVSESRRKTIKNNMSSKNNKSGSNEFKSNVYESNNDILIEENEYDGIFFDLGKIIGHIKGQKLLKNIKEDGLIFLKNYIINEYNSTIYSELLLFITNFNDKEVIIIVLDKNNFLNSFNSFTNGFKKGLLQCLKLNLKKYKKIYSELHIPFLYFDISKVYSSETKIPTLPKIKL